MISLSSFIVITQHAFFRHDKRKPILVFVDRALKGMRDPPDHDLNEGVLRKHVALLLVVRSAAGCLPPVVVISLWSNIEGDRWPSRRPETIQVCLHRKPHARHQAAQVHRALWRRGSVAARGARSRAYPSLLLFLRAVNNVAPATAVGPQTYCRRRPILWSRRY